MSEVFKSCRSQDNVFIKSEPTEKRASTYFCLRPKGVMQKEKVLNASGGLKTFFVCNEIDTG